MVISIKHEMIVFWAFVLCGQALGIFFDFFRSLRKNILHNKTLVAIEDVVFCITAFKMFFEICYVTNSGALRWYIFASLICSIVVYFCLISKYIFVIWDFLFKLSAKFLMPFKRIALFLFKFSKSLFIRLKIRIQSLFSGIVRFGKEMKPKKRPKASKNNNFIHFFRKKAFTFLKK